VERSIILKKRKIHLFDEDCEETAWLMVKAVMEAGLNEEKHLFDIITTASVSDAAPLEAVNHRIGTEIAAAVPITFEELASLCPKDGDNFVVSVDRDTVVNFAPFVFADKKITITIRGIGSLDDTVWDISFPFREDPPFQIGNDTVLILENIALVAEEFISYGVVRLNGGILVLTHATIINEMYEQRADGFDCGESINSWYCDVVESNDHGIVYGAGNGRLWAWPWEKAGDL